MGGPPPPPPFDLENYLDTCDKDNLKSMKISGSKFDRRGEAIDSCEFRCVEAACKMMEELVEALDKMEDDFDKYVDREVEFVRNNGNEAERECTTFAPFFDDGPPHRGERALDEAQLDKEGEELLEFVDKLGKVGGNSLRNLESVPEQRKLTSISLDSSDLEGEFGAFRDRTLGGLWNTIDCEYTPPARQL